LICSSCCSTSCISRSACCRKSYGTQHKSCVLSLVGCTETDSTAASVIHNNLHDNTLRLDMLLQLLVVNASDHPRVHAKSVGTRCSCSFQDMTTPGSCCC
jgi:hypothetical protein